MEKGGWPQVWDSVAAFLLFAALLLVISQAPLARLSRWFRDRVDRLQAN